MIAKITALLCCVFVVLQRQEAQGVFVNVHQENTLQVHSGLEDDPPAVVVDAAHRLLDYAAALGVKAKSDNFDGIRITNLQVHADTGGFNVLNAKSKDLVLKTKGGNSGGVVTASTLLDPWVDNIYVIVYNIKGSAFGLATVLKNSTGGAAASLKVFNNDTESGTIELNGTDISTFNFVSESNGVVTFEFPLMDESMKEQGGQLPSGIPPEQASDTYTVKGSFESFDASDSPTDPPTTKAPTPSSTTRVSTSISVLVLLRMLSALY